jgi:hypothetical protein
MRAVAAQDSDAARHDEFTLSNRVCRECEAGHRGGTEICWTYADMAPPTPDILHVPPDFAPSGDQASTLGGVVRMFSANSPHWLKGVNNPGASTGSYSGVSNPLGLSNNNAFGRLWPARAPFGLAGGPALQARCVPFRLATHSWRARVS